MSGGLWRALIYLQGVSIFNALRQRLLRLKQPRYLFGALAGSAYLYFFLFRAVSRPRQMPHADPPLDLAGASPTWVALAAAAVFVLVVFNWLIGSSRAALRFTEAEVAFLFPAPLTRGMLIHYKLLRSELALLFSALLMTLVFRRGAGGWHYALAWWLLFSCMSLHFTAASFVRERLLDFGFDAARRRWLVGALVLVLALGCGAWLRDHFRAPGAADLDGLRSIARYVDALLNQPPLTWLLAPFRWVVAPMFASNAAEFWTAAWPALLVLIAHYAWVVRSDTAFEEASIDLSRRMAERVSAIRGGKSAFHRAPTKARAEPFHLAERGPVVIAFLWKGLIEMGAFYRLRTWLLACAVVIGVGAWLRADPERVPLLLSLSVFGLTAGAWILLLGPMLMTRTLRNTFARLDLLRAGPLDGRQIVLGELAMPLVVLCFMLWLALLVAAQMFVAMAGAKTPDAHWVTVAAPAALLCAPPLIGLLLCVPMAGFVLFPAWTLQMGSRGGGVEVMGQRMIFFAAYLLMLIGALLPAAAAGGIVALIGNWLVGEIPGALLGLLAVTATLVVEFIGAVQWLGDRLENFDVSADALT